MGEIRPGGQHQVVSPGYPNGPVTPHVPPGVTYGGDDSPTNHICGVDWHVGSFTYALDPPGALIPITTNPLIPPEIANCFVWRDGMLVPINR